MITNSKHKLISFTYSKTLIYFMKLNLKTPLDQFRLVAILEGISYLLLLGIGMPLKYIAHIIIVIKIMGWMHGILFILYILTLVRVKITNKWSFIKAFVAFIASLLPFGTFVLDKKLQKEEPN
jgi:integral membrane protein